MNHAAQRVARQARAEAMAELHRTGATLPEIGAKFGVSSERVRQLLSTIGVQSSQGGFAKQREARAAAAEALKLQRAAKLQQKRDKLSVDLYGIAAAEVEELNQANAADAAACKAYRQQRRHAGERGIQWQFDYRSWLLLWAQSGKFHLRGRGTGFYCMARHGDVGPYSPGNVTIQACQENSRDFMMRARANGLMKNSGLKLGSGRGWTLLKSAKSRPYQVCVSGTPNTYHATPEEASAEYRRRCAALCEQRG